MKKQQPRLPRRNFLLAAGAGGVTTAAVFASKSPQVHPKNAEAMNGSKGYHLTDHIRKYYSTTKV